MTYTTIQDAIDNAMSPADSRYRNHVYIYKLDGAFDVYWHSKDRYVDNYLPDNAKIVAHGEKTHDPQNWSLVSIKWEQRDSNVTPDEFDVLVDALGPDIANLLRSMTDEDLSE